MKILFTPTARRQFLEAIAYIHRDIPSAAVSFRQKAEKTISRLVEFPESGRLLPEFPDITFREVIVKPYRFFYRTKDDGFVKSPNFVSFRAKREICSW